MLLWSLTCKGRRSNTADSWPCISSVGAGVILNPEELGLNSAIILVTKVCSCLLTLGIGFFSLIVQWSVARSQSRKYCTCTSVFCAVCGGKLQNYCCNLYRYSFSMQTFETPASKQIFKKYSIFVKYSIFKYSIFVKLTYID